jgi:hypothetical protein
MDWASLHCRNRGAHFWKAFTTGKSQSLGGIPHDMYGMTTRSVHQYVLGIMRKLNIKVRFNFSNNHYKSHNFHKTPGGIDQEIPNRRAGRRFGFE